MALFTPHQDQALKAVARWLKARPGRGGTPQVFRLFGYAGTGKTTLAKHIAKDVNGKVLFAAFTGKAALVMRSKGCTGAATIHSTIYQAIDTGKEEPLFELWHDGPASKAKLIVIDECSMVDAELGGDLLSFGAPVLVLGDPAQLPPVQGGGFFTEAEPNAMLTEVHRQAQDDPIVRLSMEVRAGQRPRPVRLGLTEVVERRAFEPQRALETDQMLVGRNLTRRAYNARLRERRGLTDPLPVAGDKLVCLRNNRRKKLFNGSLWLVEECRGSRVRPMKLRLTPEDGIDRREVKTHVRPECFLGGIEEIDWEFRKRCDEFDFGYVLTVHKAQGSQWNDVVLFDESFAFRENRERWLYTGITRAAKRLTLVLPDDR
jgi:ATP-dependent exoDNAse (exonuclease V) alpha subunit